MLRLLIGGSPSKIFHLKEFAKNLEKKKVECKVVIDTSIYSGFPSRKISNWFETKKKFNDLIGEFKPDAVFVDRQVNFGLAAAKMNIPLLVHLRGDYWAEQIMAKKTLYNSPQMRTVLWYKDRIAQKCFNASTMVLPICKYLEKRVHEYYPEHNTQVLYQGIEPLNWYQDFGMELKHPCVGLVQSANIWEKAKQLLILPKILEKFPNVMFYWVGDGPYAKNILPILQKYKNFKWLGKLEYPNKVRQFLSEVDIYALLTGIDMSPLTLQEAQLMEKPVIATSVGGIPELIKNQDTGFLVNKDNPDEVIEKISLLLDDSKKRQKMGKAGRQYVETNFTWDEITKSFIQIMKDLV
jgi:glycosyltransferase involved in cell wall biosynthesis